MKSRKILLVIHELTYTDSSASTLRLAKALLELGYYAEVWSFSDGNYKWEYDKAGIDVRIVPPEQFRTFKILHEIKKFDLAICNAIFTRKAAEAAENLIPAIWHIRETENIPEFFMNDFRGYYALKNAKNIWCVSEHAKEFICKYFNTNVQVIQDCPEDEMYKKNIGQNIEKHFCKNIYLYRFKNYGRRFIWRIDDLERVRVPDWGEEDKNLFSFDIFDTLITRKTATPSGIFLLMQETLLKDDSFSDINQYIKDNFYLLRQHAEGLARRSYCVKGCEDTTFDQIYEALRCVGALSDGQLERLKRLELETEYRNAIGIDENIDRVKKLIAEGKDAVLISDMYLSSEQIRMLLCKFDSVFENMDIYVSSECKKCKGSTNLFKYVQCERKVRFSNWTHIGDDEHSDGYAPERIGIKAERYKGSLLKKSEQEVINSSQRDLQAQLMIGLAKAVRINNQLEGAKSIGASCGGIMLIPYAEWLLSDAARRKIKTLYFIARDGYVLKMIADTIISHENYDISTKYIYGSRKAWRMPSYRKNDSLEKFFILNLEQLKTIGDLSRVFFLPEDVFRNYLPNIYGKHDEISLKDIDNIRNALEMQAEFKELLEEESKKRKSNVIGYIKQEIQFGGNNFAFVELSGTGTTQECLADICGDLYDEKIITYFLNLEDIKHGEKCLFINYLPNNNNMSYIIENLCRAPHGQTVSYDFCAGEYVPVLEEHETDALMGHGYLEYIEGVRLFTQEYCNEQFECFNKESPQLYISFLNYIAYAPDAEMLDFIGGMPFDATGFGTKAVEFAPRLTKRQIKEIFFLRDDEDIGQFYQGAALQYSVNRCTDEERKLIKRYQDKALTLHGHMARLGKKIKEFGYGYTFAFIFKRIVRRLLIMMDVLPDL